MHHLAAERVQCLLGQLDERAAACSSVSGSRLSKLVLSSVGSNRLVVQAAYHARAAARCISAS